MRTLQPYDLQPGMKLLEAVITPSGQVLAPAGSEITRQLINRMKLYRVASAVVEGEDITLAPVSNTAANAPVPEPPKPRTYINEVKTAKQKVASSDAFHTFQMQYALAMEELKKVFTERRSNRIRCSTVLRICSAHAIPLPSFLICSTIPAPSMIRSMHTVSMLP